MIVNRLSSLLDLETDISLDAKPILNSARLAYATNCVHLYEEKDTVVCDGEGDRIRIYGLSIKEAFEIIQGVFDYYQDWESRIQETIQQLDFQSMLDSCEILFQNPMLLLNANFHVLAMSSAYGADAVDEEWAYLSRYGYSSPSSIRRMRLDQNVNTDRFGYQAYQYTSVPDLRYGGISYNLQFNLLSCGRLIVLDKNRPLNPGDYQLLLKIAGYLEPVLGSRTEDGNLGAGALYDLVMNRPWSSPDLDIHMQYLGWSKDDSFQAAVMQKSRSTDTDAAASDNELILYTLQKLLPSAMIFLREQQIILLSNRELSRDPQLLDYFRQVLAAEHYRIGFSLFLNDFRQASSLRSQASHALTCSGTGDQDEQICYFRTYAVHYILDTPTAEDRLQACHPVVRKLWMEKQKHHDSLYDTLKQYIDQERSLARTAEVLFTHRNTVLYRLKKITALLNDNLDDSSSRYYIRLSMQCLEMTE